MKDIELVRPASHEALHFPSTDWMENAACVGQGFLWDHDTGTEGSDRAAQHAKAIAICQGCPVLALCATYAEKNDLVGVWGGRCRRTNLLIGSQSACGSCHREESLSKSTELTNRRRERSAQKERERLAAMTPEQRAAKNARRYATPELREAARQRHIAWKARRTAERKVADLRDDNDRARRRYDDTRTSHARKRAS
jgi:WhiB family redox-sensing transcriptional regulator